MVNEQYKDMSGQLYEVIQDIWACDQVGDSLHIISTYGLEPQNFLMFLGETSEFYMQEDWTQAVKRRYFKFFDLKHQKVCWLRNDYLNDSAVKLVPCNY